MSKTGVVKGYKVFNPDWTCGPEGNTKQYTCPGKFEEANAPIWGERGMHFCKKAADCFHYYRFNPENKVAEVIAYGDIAEKGDKCCTNKLEIVREIPWTELLKIVNTGKTCTGLLNSGDCNSGNFNSGNWNSGDCNSGNRNSGDRNSGNYNSGDYNSGDYNTGHHNSGDWNNASNVVGCFNTESQKLKFFDKETDMTYEQWWNSDARCLLNQIDFRPVNWIWSNDMTDEEKAEHPEYETTGGYLKIRDNTDCCIEWWNGLSESDRNIIRSIPNFDAEKFYQITGIIAVEE